MRRKPRPITAGFLFALLLGALSSTATVQAADSWAGYLEDGPDFVWVKMGGARLPPSYSGTNFADDAPTTHGVCNFNILRLSVAHSAETIASSDLRRVVVGDNACLFVKITVPASLREMKAFLDSRPDVLALEQRTAKLKERFDWAQSSPYSWTSWKINNEGYLSIERWGHITTQATLRDNEKNVLCSIEYKAWPEAERELEESIKQR